VSETEIRTVIFAPLNWGLGHVSRSIPLINKYKKDAWRILLASDGDSAKLLQKEFPDIKVLEIPSELLKYSQTKSLIAHLQVLLPAFLRNIKRDQLFVNKLLNKEQVDLIVSDNRYGFYSSKVESVILTHQLQLPLPKYLRWTKKIVQNKLSKWISNFNECWIVDDEKHSLAGDLSNEENLRIPFKFLGLQSRFVKEDKRKEIDFLVVLSGLEPYRTVLEKKIIELFTNENIKVTIVGGQFKNETINSKIKYLAFADGKLLNELMNKSKVVIARSGYSTIMDLIKLDKKAILIPTPGQEEQLYLASYHNRNNNFFIVNCNDLDISKLKNILLL